MILAHASGSKNLGPRCESSDEVTCDYPVGALAGALERAGANELCNLLVEFKFLWRPAFRTATTTPPGRFTSELAINRLPLGLLIGLCPPLCQTIDYLLRTGRLFHRAPLILLSDLILPGKFRFHNNHYFYSYRR
jgi:hypothetical protein